MEYLEHGDLLTYLHQRPPLPEAEAKHIAYQILDGLSLMHENGFAHRDLKPNVGFLSILEQGGCTKPNV
jgi:serine/threonine protein kinase